MTSPESRLKEIRERWDKNGEDDCYSINEIFEAMGLAFAQLDLANKRCEILREALNWYARFEITQKWDGVISPNTPFSKYIEGSFEPISPAREALKAADEVKV